jgi:hypothetical protein
MGEIFSVLGHRVYRGEGPLRAPLVLDSALIGDKIGGS